LADIFHPAACLANFCFLKTHPRPRTPSEYREGAGAYFTFFPVAILGLKERKRVSYIPTQPYYFKIQEKMLKNKF